MDREQVPDEGREVLEVGSARASTSSTSTACGRPRSRRASRAGRLRSSRPATGESGRRGRAAVRVDRRRSGDGTRPSPRAASSAAGSTVRSGERLDHHHPAAPLLQVVEALQQPGQLRVAPVTGARSPLRPCSRRARTSAASVSRRAGSSRSFRQSARAGGAPGVVLGRRDEVVGQVAGEVAGDVGDDGPLACQHDVEGRPEAVEVGAPIHDLPRDLLGRHRGDRPHQLARHGGWVVNWRPGASPRRSPSAWRALLDHQHVIGEVPVDQARDVDRARGFTEVPEDDLDPTEAVGRGLRVPAVHQGAESTSTYSIAQGYTPCLPASKTRTTAGWSAHAG